MIAMKTPSSTTHCLKNLSSPEYHGITVYYMHLQHSLDFPFFSSPRIISTDENRFINTVIPVSQKSGEMQLLVKQPTSKKIRGIKEDLIFSINLIYNVILIQIFFHLQFILLAIKNSCLEAFCQACFSYVPELEHLSLSYSFIGSRL